MIYNEEQYGDSSLFLLINIEKFWVPKVIIDSQMWASKSLQSYAQVGAFHMHKHMKGRKKKESTLDFYIARKFYHVVKYGIMALQGSKSRK